MDAYELHLFGMAVEACEARGDALLLWPMVLGRHDPPPPDLHWAVQVLDRRGGNTWERSAPTLADALETLLADLGVKVPERPTAERVAALEQRFLDGYGFPQISWSGVRGFLDELTVVERLALLEGESA